jgi:hypothetical protein
MGDPILLVEGKSDRSFFEEICKTLKLHAMVNVVSPKDVGRSHDGKEGVFNLLPDLLKLLPDAQITRLAVIVDADSAANGGYQRTIDKVTEIVAPEGYTLRSDHVAGLIFQHDDGLADFGLWVMPNNCDEGMLEDWIKHCIHPDENNLFAHAETVVDTLPQTKFKPIHISKAEVATWLAWQKKPGHGLYRAIEENLIDTNSELFKELSDWLNYIYGSEDE